MAVSDVHDQYTENAQDWQLVTDSLKESRIKAADEKYLPRTSGQVHYRNQNKNDDSPYQAYQMRARFPLLVNPAVSALTGLAHRTPGELVVPARFEDYLESITPNAEPFEELSRQTVRAVLLHGRYGLLSDVDSNGEPYIAGYDAKSIINWKTGVVDGRQVYTLIVLKESEDVSTDEFKSDFKDRFRVLKLEDEGYSVRVFDEKGNLIDEPEARTASGRNLDEIPFVIVGSLDLTTDVDESPMLPLAKTAVSIYQLDADYRQSLHMTAQPTFVTIGAGEDPPNVVGATIAVHLPQDADAKYVEVSGNGIEAQREEINDEYERAKTIGGELSKDSSRAESGEALRVRMFSRHASLHSVANVAGAGLERSVRYCAKMVGIPGESTYSPNTDFTGKEVNETLIKVINDTVNSGNLPRSVLFEATRTAGLSEKDDDELLDEIESDPIGLGPVIDDDPVEDEPEDDA